MFLGQGGRIVVHDPRRDVVSGVMGDEEPHERHQLGRGVAAGLIPAAAAMWRVVLPWKPGTENAGPSARIAGDACCCGLVDLTP